MSIMMIMMLRTMMEVMMMMGAIVMMAMRRRRMNAKQAHAHSSSIIWVKFNFDNRDLKCFVWHLHWAQSRNLAFSKDSLCFHLYQWIWCLFFYSTSPLSHIAEVTITIVVTIGMVTIVKLMMVFISKISKVNIIKLTMVTVIKLMMANIFRRRAVRGGGHDADQRCR